MEYNLLQKTEVWVTGLELDTVNLTDLAGAAAGALGLHREEVVVVDVRPGLVTFDLLRRTIQAADVAGKQAALLEALRQVPGVALTLNAAVHSDGILGIIALTPDEAEQTLARSQQMTTQILAAVARRAIVFPTGSEVQGGLIRDTNSPFIKEELEKLGFRVKIGPILEDDLAQVIFHLREALNQGYGLVITTGGVGAESKDHTVEGMLQLDPAAATPWLVHYARGEGRHVKDGVRIAVAQVGPTTLVALPGPHTEVRQALPVLLRHWNAASLDKHQLAEVIAAELRGSLSAQMRSHMHHE